MYVAFQLLPRSVVLLDSSLQKMDWFGFRVLDLQRKALRKRMVAVHYSVPLPAPGVCAPALAAELSDVYQGVALFEAIEYLLIDGDLYVSARDALAGVSPLIQDGIIIIFDNWVAFKGNPDLGKQKAFSQWLDRMPSFQAVPFRLEGTWRNAFVMCRRIDRNAASN